MNKKVFGRKLSRSRPARESLFATLAKSMIINGKMVTTRAKAKAVQADVEKMVTLAKKGDIAARRNILGKLDNQREAAEILFQKVAKAFPTKNSGFTRIISLPRRVGDNAKMVRMEWTEKVEYEDKRSLASQSPGKSKKAESKKEKKAVKPASAKAPAGQGKKIKK
jgi:large subunit ribosomal protein L17